MVDVVWVVLDMADCVLSGEDELEEFVAAGKRFLDSVSRGEYLSDGYPSAIPEAPFEVPSSSGARPEGRTLTAAVEKSREATSFLLAGLYVACHTAVYPTVRRSDLLMRSPTIIVDLVYTSDVNALCACCLRNATSSIAASWKACGDVDNAHRPLRLLSWKSAADPLMVGRAHWVCCNGVPRLHDRIVSRVIALDAVKPTAAVVETIIP